MSSWPRGRSSRARVEENHVRRRRDALAPRHGRGGDDQGASASPASGSTPRPARCTSYAARAGAEGWVFIVHNQFLLVWAETGIFGLLGIHLVCSVLALRAASRLKRSTDPELRQRRTLALLVAHRAHLGAQHGPRERGADLQARVLPLRGGRWARRAWCRRRVDMAVDEAGARASADRHERARRHEAHDVDLHVVRESEARTPLVSVIVPALNSARTIGRCMAALAAQHTRHLFEVIVVHSGEDDTCAVAARTLPQVAHHPAARSARSRHAPALPGVAVARGDIFAFIDSDAYAAPDWIEQVVRSAESGRDLICGSIGNANPDSAVAAPSSSSCSASSCRETPQRRDVVRAVRQPGDAPRDVRALRPLRRDPRRRRT